MKVTDSKKRAEFRTQVNKHLAGADEFWDGDDAWECFNFNWNKKDWFKRPYQFGSCIGEMLNISGHSQWVLELDEMFFDFFWKGEKNNE